MKHPIYYEEVGGLRFTVNQKESMGGFWVAGFPGETMAAVSVTSYNGGSLNLYRFSRQQLEALSRVASMAAKTADPEPEPDGPEVSC